MEKKVICIGFHLPGHSDLYYKYSSNQSLLDADVIIFEPDFSDYEFDPQNAYFQGKRCFSQDSSFELKEATTHWKSELTTAIENGKTVLVFLNRYEDVFIHTGEKKTSGTGKNTKTTNIVSNYNSFNFFPIKLPSITPKKGKVITFCGNPVFSTYWSEFKDLMIYEAYLNERNSNAIFLTRTGEKTLGTLYKIGKGNLVLLPPLNYDKNKFIKYQKSGRETWTTEAIQFGNRLLKEIVNIDKVLRKESEKTPPPQWLTNTSYDLAKEIVVLSKIEKANEAIDKLVDEKNELHIQLDEVLKLKDLLFEKGKNLENAVSSALHILGYSAENFNEGTLELDQIILSPEGDRFIGEIEGKDTSAISIEKFRQLSLNIHEDLQREEVSEPAIGILFGNGFRLTSPEERQEQFTPKCITVAQTSNCILIKTCDLFPIAKYIQESDNNDFAKVCRETIKNSIGKTVVFPIIPT